MAVRYKSSRYTEDVDFSTSEKYSDIDDKEFKIEIESALSIACDEIPYNIVCQLQTFKSQPKDAKNASFPSLKLTIGYCNRKDESSMRRLERGEAVKVVSVDYSFNEDTHELDELYISDDDHLGVYSYNEVIAEKLRSILQQKSRKRNRRQDVYDIYYLLTDCAEPSEEEGFSILRILKEKSKGRLEEGEVNRMAMRDPEIVERSKKEYEFMEEEVEGDLPEFYVAFEKVKNFYESLPWEFVE